MTDLDFDEKKGQLDEIIAEAKARKERAGKDEARKRDDPGHDPEALVHAARTEAAAAEDRFARMLTVYRARRKEVDRTPMPEDQKKELESRLDEIDGLLKDEHVALRGGVAMPPPLPWVGQDEPTHPHVDVMPDAPGFAAARTVPGKEQPEKPPQVAHGAVAEPVPATPESIGQHPHQPARGRAHG